MTREDAHSELMFGLLLIVAENFDLSPSDVIEAIDSALEGDNRSLALIRLLTGQVCESKWKDTLTRRPVGRPPRYAENEQIAMRADVLIACGEAANDREAARILDGGKRDWQRPNAQDDTVRKQIRAGRRSLAKLRAQRFGGLILSLIEDHDRRAYLADLEGREPIGEVIREMPA